MGKILQILIIENRDLAHAQTFCTRVYSIAITFISAALEMSFLYHVSNEQFKTKNKAGVRFTKLPAENIAWSRKTIFIAQGSLAQMQLFKKIQMEK